MTQEVAWTTTEPWSWLRPRCEGGIWWTCGIRRRRARSSRRSSSAWRTASGTHRLCTTCCSPLEYHHWNERENFLELYTLLSCYVMFRFVFFRMFQFPIGLLNSCSISLAASGKCQKCFIKHQDWAGSPECVGTMSHIPLFLSIAVHKNSGPPSTEPTSDWWRSPVDRRTWRLSRCRWRRATLWMPWWVSQRGALWGGIHTNTMILRNSLYENKFDFLFCLKSKAFTSAVCCRVWHMSSLGVAVAAI